MNIEVKSSAVLDPLGSGLGDLKCPSYRQAHQIQAHVKYDLRAAELSHYQPKYNLGLSVVGRDFETKGVRHGTCDLGQTNLRLSPADRQQDLGRRVARKSLVDVWRHLGRYLIWCFRTGFWPVSPNRPRGTTYWPTVLAVSGHITTARVKRKWDGGR